MKIILVDDEPLALFRLRRALERESEEADIAAEYTDPNEVVAGVLAHRPDVVFLDIQMPEIDGLKLGRQLQAAVPGIEIVFVTAYDRYAVKAFELYALDYIMKPVQDDRLRQTLLRVEEKLRIKKAKPMPDAHSPIIRCLGQIRFQLPGREAQLAKWRTSKALELFSYLLHHWNRMVNRGTLLELLWPEVEADKAAQHLYTAIYHIRQTLRACKMDKVIVIRAGELESGYRLDIGNACVESEAWERRLRQLGALTADNAEEYESALASYTGDYLGDYDYLWAEHERERLRMLWQHQMKRLGQFYEEAKLFEKALEVHRCLQSVYPEQEDNYFSLMKLYDALEHRDGVEEQYGLLVERVEKEQELPISDEIVLWYERWKSESGRGAGIGC